MMSVEMFVLRVFGCLYVCEVWCLLIWFAIVLLLVVLIRVFVDSFGLWVVV